MHINDVNDVSTNTHLLLSHYQILKHRHCTEMRSMARYLQTINDALALQCVLVYVTSLYYRPQMKFGARQYFCTCLPFCSQKGDLAGTPTPLGRYTPGQVHPRQCMLGYCQQAGGTHHTGMHSCFVMISVNYFLIQTT